MPPSAALIEASLSVDAAQPAVDNAVAVIRALQTYGWIDAGAVWWRTDRSRLRRVARTGSRVSLPASVLPSTLPSSPRTVTPRPVREPSLFSLPPDGGAGLLVPLSTWGLWWGYREPSSDSFSDDEQALVQRLGEAVCAGLEDSAAARVRPAPHGDSAAEATAPSGLESGPEPSPVGAGAAPASDPRLDDNLAAPLFPGPSGSLTASSLQASGFKALVDTLPAGAVVLNADHRLIYANPATWKLFHISPSSLGYRPDGLAAGRGRPVEEVVASLAHQIVDVDRFLDDVRARLTEQVPVEGESIPLIGGTVAERSYTPVVRDGTTLGHVFVYWDVTEHRRTAADLSDLKTLYQQMVEALPAQIVLTDPDGRIEFTSSPPVSGRSEEKTQTSVRGRTLPEVAHARGADPEPARRRHEHIRKAAGSGETVRFETTRSAALSSTGSGASAARFFIRHAVPIVQEGAVARVLEFGVDVTDQKQTEARLADAHEAAENALQRQQKFLSALAHEVRTPLHAVLGLTEALAASNLTPEQEQHLDHLRFSADALLALLNEMPSRTATPAEEPTRRARPFNPARLCRGVVATLRARPSSPPVELSASADASVPATVVGDDLRLKQILWNLLANALEATDAGTVHCHVDPPDPPRALPAADGQPPGDGLTGDARSSSTGPSPPDGDPVLLSFHIADTGPGLSPADRRRVAHPPDSDGARTGRTDTGLGLTIVRDLVDRLGGTIEVESTAGEGTLFTVTLPFRTPAADLDARDGGRKQPVRPAVLGGSPGDRPSDRSGDRMHDSISLQDRRLLVVEDTPSNQMIITHVLEAAGAEVSVADRGVEALEWLTTHPVDAVLLDLHLPEMDGLETGRRIRTELGRSHVPLIALSAAGTALAERVEEADFDDYLAKPFRAADLRRCVHAAFSPEPPPDDAPSPSDAPRRRTLSAGSDPVDLEQARHHAAVFDTTVPDLIDAFLEDARRFEETLAAASPSSDADAVREACHQLKTSAHLVGASAVFTLLCNVEGEWMPVDARTISTLRTRLAEARTALNEAS